MGSYYEAVIERDNKKKMYYTHDVNEGLKLMEHSYIGNEYTERIMSMLVNNPSPVVWLCDYHEEPGCQWSDFEEASKDEFLTASTFTNSDDINYIILNHTKKLFIDIPVLEKLLIEKDPELWLQIHPIPILCNSDEYSQGGGDFHKEDSRRATWKNDIIEVINKSENNIPEDFKDVTEDVLFFE